MWLAQFLLVLVSMATVVAVVGILLYLARIYIFDEPSRSKVCDDVLDYTVGCAYNKPPENDPFDEFGGSYAISSSASATKRRRGG